MGSLCQVSVQITQPASHIVDHNVLLVNMIVIIIIFLFTETDNDPRHTLTASGSLILKDVSFEDTAIYQCQASNKHGTIITNTHIYVIGMYRPLI